MSEPFKDEVVNSFQNSEILGIVCMDSLGMVCITLQGINRSLFLTSVI